MRFGKHFGGVFSKKYFSKHIPFAIRRKTTRFDGVFFKKTLKNLLFNNPPGQKMVFWPKKALYPDCKTRSSKVQ